MAPGRNQDEPWLQREGLFRQRLNQLRQTGETASPIKPPQPGSRTRELEHANYLQNVPTRIEELPAEELERKTLLDPLTQLYNQNTIARIIKDEIKRAKRYKHELSLVLISIDEFDKINAEHGTTVIDSVSQGTAAFLMKAIRDVDIPSRLDDGKFLVICPATDAAGVQIMAERIRNKIRLERVSDIHRNWHVSLSIGLANLVPSLASADQLLEQAENALHRSESAGGNTISIA